MNATSSFATTKTQRIREALDRAEFALRAYDVNEAQTQLDAALHLDPGHAEARLLEARAHMMPRQPQDTLRAIDAHDQYGQADQDQVPPRLDTTLMRASALAQLGKTALAIKQFETLADLAPQDLGILRSLAALQLKDGRAAEAIESLTLICDLDPQDRICARALSGLLAEDAPSRAADALGKVGDDERLQAARLCRRAGRLLEAERHYAALLQEECDAAWLLVEAGALAVEMSELTRAEDRLHEAAVRGGGRGGVAREAWSLLAVQWMRRGRAVRAGHAWWRAARADASSYPRGWAGLLVCATRAQRETLMRKTDRMLRGQTSRAQRREQIAAQWLDLAPAAYAEPGSDTVQTAGPEAETSPLDVVLAEAVDTLRLTTERYPGRADVHFHHAVLLDASRRTDEALEEATAALAINPGYRAAQRLGGKLAA